jgi:hypothetical protein
VTSTSTTLHHKEFDQEFHHHHDKEFDVPETGDVPEV